MSISLTNKQEIKQGAEYYRRTQSSPIYEFNRDTGQLITLPPYSIPDELITFDVEAFTSDI